MNANFDTMVGVESFVMCWLSRNKAQKNEKNRFRVMLSLFHRIPNVLFLSLNVLFSGAKRLYSSSTQLVYLDTYQELTVRQERL